MSALKELFFRYCLARGLLAPWTRAHLTKTLAARRLFPLGGGWGHRIEWQCCGVQIVGWMQSRPVVGDVVLSPMVSGKTGAHVILRVERPGDPHDMFFADVALAGYYVLT